MIEEGEIYRCLCGCRHTVLLVASVLDDGDYSCWFREGDDDWRPPCRFVADLLGEFAGDKDAVLAEFTAWRLTHE